MSAKGQVTHLELTDLRFPTSKSLDGSDAMNPDPDYSAAYVVVRTDAPDDLAGHGFAFTIGRGNEVQLAAIAALEPLVAGRELAEVFADMGAFARSLSADSQLRWLGPEKGVIHMAVSAVVNAMWDAYAKHEGLPLWRLLARMTPEEIVDLVDFRHLTDVCDRDEALELLAASAGGKADRIAQLEREGIGAYTTSPGWLGYTDDKLRRLVREAVADGFTHVKLKVGADLDDDVRRVTIAREELGPDLRLSIDANQTWEVDQAIASVKALAGADLYWIEEPTSPDDILGHQKIAMAVGPVRVATGEHMHNRVMFKQFLAADALQIAQIDACRLGGVNEVIAVLLLAAKHGVPVCPHAGGVGLCELVQHVAAFDFVALGGRLEDRVVEFVDHLHEHFIDPVRVERARYLVPTVPGYSTEIHPETLSRYAFPDGPAWGVGEVA